MAQKRIEHRGDCFTIGSGNLLLSPTDDGTTWQAVTLPLVMTNLNGLGCGGAGGRFMTGLTLSGDAAILTDYVALVGIAPADGAWCPVGGSPAAGTGPGLSRGGGHATMKT